MRRLLLPGLLLALAAFPQDAPFPLESAAIQGSVIPQPVVLEITGLRIGTPIDKAGIEVACAKLQASGLFASISYAYSPGPNKGYAVSLNLADQPLTPASIDIPGVDENEVWQWLSGRFHRFDHNAPQVDSAQKFLAAEIERHLGAQMRGQHVTVRIETDLRTRKLTLSFQPEVLPRIQSVTFTGNTAVSSADLSTVLNRVASKEDYTARKFAALVELNVRPFYEEHGFYRVQLTPGAPQFSEAGVALAVAVVEGAAYQLRNVTLDGESLPEEAMLKAAKLPLGKLANWRQIQDGLWAMEKVVRRTGYMETVSNADRTLDDAVRTLDLRIRFRKGPLYRFGEVRITGLSPTLQERARRIWAAKPGDPYDFLYPNEFMIEFFKGIDARGFSRHDALPQRAAGDHVMDVNLIFEGK